MSIYKLANVKDMGIQLEMHGIEKFLKGRAGMYWQDDEEVLQTIESFGSIGGTRI